MRWARNSRFNFRENSLQKFLKRADSCLSICLLLFNFSGRKCMVFRLLRQLFQPPMSLPHNPERRRLVSQIKQLQKELSKIDQTTPPSDVLEPPLVDSPAGATTSGTTASSERPKSPRRKQTRGANQDIIGPLPPTLANAPKRHVALLFS